MKLKISYKGQEGYVEYIKKTKEIKVVFPNKHAVKKVNKLLHTKRVYQIPKSNRIDDYREDLAYPYDNETYFELSMNVLWANTGVYVNW